MKVAESKGSVNITFPIGSQECESRCPVTSQATGSRRKNWSGHVFGCWRIVGPTSDTRSSWDAVHVDDLERELHGSIKSFERVAAAYRRRAQDDKLRELLR